MWTLLQEAGNAVLPTSIRDLSRPHFSHYYKLSLRKYVVREV